MTIRELIAALENLAKEHGDNVIVELDNDGIFEAPCPTFYDGWHSDGTNTGEFVIL